MGNQWSTFNVMGSEVCVLNACHKKPENMGSCGKGLSNFILKVAMPCFLTEFNPSSLFNGKCILNSFSFSLKSHHYMLIQMCIAFSGYIMITQVDKTSVLGYIRK